MATDMFRACLPLMARPRASTLSFVVVHRRPGTWFGIRRCTSVVPWRLPEDRGVCENLQTCVIRVSPYTRSYSVLSHLQLVTTVERCFRVPVIRGDLLYPKTETPLHTQAAKLRLFTVCCRTYQVPVVGIFISLIFQPNRQIGEATHMLSPILAH